MQAYMTVLQHAAPADLFLKEVVNADYWNDSKL